MIEYHKKSLHPNDKKNFKNFPALPCLGEALKRGALLKMNILTLFLDF
jgi:hypothetical protein